MTETELAGRRREILQQHHVHARRDSPFQARLRLQ